MTSTVEAVVSSVRAIQGALLVIAGLQLTGYMYPQSTTVTNGASYDFIICGAGTGGSVIANRLTEIPNINVLLIEAGDDPRIESLLPGLLTLQPLTEQDFNFTSEDDGRTGQYLKDRVVGMTQGKMLGGSSSLNHLIHARGNARDYQRWADAAQDESWNFDNLMQYFIKSEKVEDEDILKSKLGKYHGTEGYLRVSTQRSDENIPIFEAFAELDHENVLTANTPEFTVGITEPLLNIADGKRQSTAEYLRPLSDRPNFHIMKNTHVTKVLFDDDRNAIGVEAVTAGGETVTINANIEVILAAGAFVTPQLLMLSGVGPKDHLESFNIDVISDLPVGKNLQDHVDPVVIHALQEGEAPTAPANPHEYPVPTTVAYTALDMNQGYPDYQTINLLFPPDSTGLIQFCSLVFAYNDEICQKWFDGGKGRYTLFTCHNLMQPYSTGEVLLRSADPKDPPIIHHGIFSNETDLHNMALYLKDFARFGKTSYMKNVGGFLIDLELEECKGLSKDSYEYWRCYALSMSATLWHYSSTASMGPVLDSHLRVKGVNRLRVADSSAMPNTVSGNPMAAVVALAEKAADLIKKDNGASPRSSN